MHFRFVLPRAGLGPTFRRTVGSVTNDVSRHPCTCFDCEHSDYTSWRDLSTSEVELVVESNLNMRMRARTTLFSLLRFSRIHLKSSDTSEIHDLNALLKESEYRMSETTGGTFPHSHVGAADDGVCLPRSHVGRHSSSQ